MTDAPERIMVSACGKVIVTNQKAFPGDVEYIRADLALPAPQPVGVKVKPLEWLWNGRDRKNVYSRSIIGEYHVRKTASKANDSYIVTYVDPRRGSHTIGYADGVAAGMSLAQADCERRILSALDPAPDLIPRDEALAMAGAAWHDGFSQGDTYARGMVGQPGPPDDATAALKRATDAAKAEGKREGLEEAAQKVEDLTNYVDGMIAVAVAAAHIRALIKKEGPADA
ncbi:MAG: hypothetical protein GYB51_18965 [Rhodobacteraceae bacterium]|nr:hypothetical protein [Paracoccaceae bacterium]